MPEDLSGISDRSSSDTGLIYFNGLERRYSCVVCSINDFEAVIEADLSASIYFKSARIISADLCVDKTCRVIWRAGRKVGLEFGA